MKRLLVVVICLLLTFSLVGCGGAETAQQPEKSPAADEAGVPAASGDKQAAICDSYESFSDAKDAYEKNILKASKDHEVVSINQSLVTAFELKILHYLLPLNYLGQSIKTTGNFDMDMEVLMFETGWADNVNLIDNGDGSYQVTGEKEENKWKVDVAYDVATDSLRLVGYQNDVLVIVFEYCKIGNGYAAQYYFENVTDNIEFQPVYKWCTYRTIFEGNNGSSSRFEGVEEPDSIYKNAPDAETFISGATQWLTITDGSFIGKLNGKEF
ncbi:MAG: hypothetical protein GX825_07680 [Syntrophomonadaceae bacterium]|nr:hypothetical protein [Syntrophomonadaceae bacterium]